MLKEYANAAVDTMFPFTAAFLNRDTGFGENSALTTDLTLHSDNFNQLLYTDLVKDNHRTEDLVESRNVRQLKVSPVNLFKGFNDFILFTLELHKLDHNLKDVSRFTTLSFLDAYLFEYSIYLFKTFLKISSM